MPFVVLFERASVVDGACEVVPQVNGRGVLALTDAEVQQVDPLIAHGCVLTRLLSVLVDGESQNLLRSGFRLARLTPLMARASANLSCGISHHSPSRRQEK